MENPPFIDGLTIKNADVSILLWGDHGLAIHDGDIQSS